MREVESEGNLKSILMTNRIKFALFYASWCPFCNSFLPIFEEHAKKYNSAEFLRVKIDNDMNPLWEKYDIKIVPTVIFFRGRKLEKRLDGESGIGLSEEQLENFIEST